MANGEWTAIIDALPEIRRRVEVNYSHGGYPKTGRILDHHLTTSKRVVFCPDDYTSGVGWFMGTAYLHNTTRWRYIDLPDEDVTYEINYEVTSKATKETHMQLAASSIRVKGGRVPVVYECDNEGYFDADEAVLVWQGDLSSPITDLKDDDGKVTVSAETKATEVASEIISTFFATGIEAAAKKVLS